MKRNKNRKSWRKDKFGMNIYVCRLKKVSKPKSNSSKREQISPKRHLHLLVKKDKNKVLELLRPGTFANLDTQPNDLPPFQVINCKGGRCLVRQQAWGKYVHWEVEHHRLKSA